MFFSDQSLKDYYFKRFIYLGTSHAVSKGGMFLLNISLATQLSSYQYGKYSIYFATINLFAILYTFGIGNYLAKQISIIKKDYKKYLINSLAIFLTLSLFVSLFCLLIINTSYINYFTLFGGITWAFILIQKNFYQAKNEIQKNLIFDSIKIILPGILLIYAFLFKGGIVLEDIVNFFLFSFLILSSLIIHKLFRYRKQLNFDLSIEILFKSIPLLPYMAFMWIINVSDRYIIEYYIGIESVGEYSLIYSLASIFAVGIGLINAIYINKMFQDLSRSKKNIKKYFKILVPLFLVIGLFSCFAGVWLDYIIGYGIERNILYILIVALFFNALYTIVGNFIFFLNRKKLLVISSFLGAIVNVIFNLFLIPYLGVYGAAFGTLLSYLIMFLFSIIKVRYEI